MLNKKKILMMLLGTSLLSLSSCGKVSEHYLAGQYENGSFTDYFFMNHDEIGEKKGIESKTVTVNNGTYWNGTNDGGSSTYTPLVYKVTPNGSNTITGDSYTFTVDWSVYEAKGNQKDGYVWYWRDYVPSLKIKTMKGESDISNSAKITFSSSNNDVAQWKDNSSTLIVNGEGECTLTVALAEMELSVPLKLEASISVKAPYGERKGLSDEAPELLDHTVKDQAGSNQKISLSSLYDWVPQYVDQSDEQFFSKNPSFGRYYSLGRVDSRFKNGYLSKLYNGQLYCDGYHSLAFVCIENNGFTQLFPKKIENADYFVMSFRGGSDYTGGRNSYGSEPRLSAFDLYLDFYYENNGKYDYVTVKNEKVVTETDHGGEATTMFGFRFSEIGVDAKNICGIGVHYSSFEDLYSSVSGKISSEMPKKNEYQFGLLMYEIMFPNASWVDR